MKIIIEITSNVGRQDINLSAEGKPDCEAQRICAAGIYSYIRDMLDKGQEQNDAFEHIERN